MKQLSQSKTAVLEQSCDTFPNMFIVILNSLHSFNIWPLLKLLSRLPLKLKKNFKVQQKKHWDNGKKILKQIEKNYIIK